MKSKMKRAHYLKIGLMFVFLASYGALYAGSGAEQATRQTDILGREEKARVEKALRKYPETPPIPKVEVAPPQKEEPKFFVKNITLVGCESFPCESFSPIVTKYENKEEGLSDLEDLAREIEREYLKRGVVAAVFVPEQEAKTESITLQIVEAKMGSLLIPELEYFSKKRLVQYWKIPAGQTLYYDKIVRSVQMMNKNPDREVKAALRAGAKPGTTDVILTAQTNFPVHFNYTFDTEGVVVTGKARQGFGVRHNNFLGLDDTLITGYTFGNSFFGSYAYHNLPINSQGTSVLYGYNRSHSVPKKQYSPFGLLSEVKDTSISLHQDFYKKEDYLGEAYLTFDANDKVIRANLNDMIPNPTKDRLRVFRLGGNLIKRAFGSTTYITPELSQGADAFGASSRGNPYASRGAKSDFTKLTLNVSHRRLLPFNLQANLKFNAQVSSTRLTPQEEFSLGGIDSVRGYPSGDYLADNVVAASAELLFPTSFIPATWSLPYAEKPLRDQVTPLVFVDYGRGTRRGPAPTDEKVATFTGVGAGLRFRLYNQAFLRLEWGIPVGDKSITEAGKSRFHFAVNFQDMLPEEIERFNQIKEDRNVENWSVKLVDVVLSAPDSRLRRKLYQDLSLAEAAYKAGQLKEARDLYQTVLEACKSLSTDSQTYLRTGFSAEKAMQERNKQAMELAKEGKPEEARLLCKQVINDAKIEPLTLEF